MVTELNPDALAVAALLDAERANRKLRGYLICFFRKKNCAKVYSQVSSPLHGLPILVKMNIGTKDKMNTTGKDRFISALRICLPNLIARQLDLMR